MAMNRKNQPIERLTLLLEQADADFAGIHERQAARMQCRAGCSACCRARLSITRIEEAFLREGLATMSEDTRAELSARTRQKNREMCPALDDDGRCGIYPFRPLICRTYGAPLRHRHEVPMVNPPIVDVCDLNFVELSLKALPLVDVYDQTTAVESLEAIDREHCERNELPLGERIPIAHLLG
jgi:Fe-S-cluster containining protein